MKTEEQFAINGGNAWGCVLSGAAFGFSLALGQIEFAAGAFLAGLEACGE